MAPQIRTVDCSAREANQRLRSARAYLEAAELILVDNREDFAGVAAGNAVLAEIAADHAICPKGLRKCFRGDDRRQAATTHYSNTCKTNEKLKFGQRFRRHSNLE